MSIANPYRKNGYTRLICLISFFASCYLFLHPLENRGAFLYFTIPLTYSICCYAFGGIVNYHKGSFGLKMFYIVSVFRYIVLPVLTGITGGYFKYYSENALIYGIIMTDIEIVVCCITIRYSYCTMWKKSFRRILKTNRYDDIGIGGLIILLVAVLFLQTRGINSLLSMIRFGTVRNKLVGDFVYSYDIWLAHTLMAFLVITTTSYFQRKNDKRDSLLNAIIPLITVVLTCLTAFGNNRMVIVYYFIAGLMVLFTAFPKKKGLFLIVIIPAFTVMIVTFTMMKQFSIDVSSTTNNIYPEFGEITSTLSGYICGVDNVAATYDLFGIRGHEMQVLTIISDIVNDTKILGLPVLNNIPKVFADIPTSIDLATQTSEMVSVAGQTLFYGGYFLGPAMDVLAYIVIMRMLIMFDIKSQLSTSIGKVYINTWLSVLFGMSMCYCLSTLYSNITYIPFFTTVLVSMNNSIKIHRHRHQPLNKTRIITGEIVNE